MRTTDYSVGCLPKGKAATGCYAASPSSISISGASRTAAIGAEAMIRAFLARRL